MKTILLAEDDKNFGSVLQNELQEDGYAVCLAPDGVEAILSFLTRAYDFVLLDIRMPRLNGIDALRIIKTINPAVPVITFSGTAGSREQQESVEAGSIKFLVKPFQIDLLKEEIKSLSSSPGLPSPRGSLAETGNYFTGRPRFSKQDPGRGGIGNPRARHDG